MPDHVHFLIRPQPPGCGCIKKHVSPGGSTFSKQTIKDLLLQRIESLDVEKAKNDVQPFIKDMREIELWSKEFFVSVIENIKVR